MDPTQSYNNNLQNNNKKLSSYKIAKIAILSATSTILYYFVKFPLPFLFPQFLDIQISELPALIAGFLFGPVEGVLVVLIKTLIKLPASTTACIGELADLIMGSFFVLVSSLIYKKYHTKKAAIIALVAGTSSTVIIAIFLNAFIILPFYINWYGLNAVIGMMSNLYPNLNQKNLYAHFILLAVIPFNIIRCSISAVVTFYIYKRVQFLFAKIRLP